MKKILSVLLCAILLVGLIPMSAFAKTEKIAKLSTSSQFHNAEGSKFWSETTIEGDSGSYIYAAHICFSPDEFLFYDSIYQKDIGDVTVNCSGEPYDGFEFGLPTSISNVVNTRNYNDVMGTCLEIVKLSVDNWNDYSKEWFDDIEGCVVLGYAQVIPPANKAYIFADSIVPGAAVDIKDTGTSPRYDGLSTSYVGWFNDMECTIPYDGSSSDGCYVQLKISDEKIKFPTAAENYILNIGGRYERAQLSVKENWYWVKGGEEQHACDVKLVDGELFVTFTIDTSKIKQITCPDGYEIVSGTENGHALPGNVITIERTVAEGDHKFISSVLANGSQINYWHSERSEDEWNAEHGNTVRFTMPDEDVTLSIDTCENDKVIIDAKGGTVNFGDNGVLYIVEQSHQYNSIIIKNDCCTRDGYKLIGFSYTVDGAGPDLFFDAEGIIYLTPPSANDKHDEIKLYAIWEKAGGAEVIPGDTNGDGAVDNKDVVVLFRYVSSASGSEYDPAFDFNGDSVVDNKDVVSLFRHVSAA